MGAFNPFEDADFTTPTNASASASAHPAAESLFDPEFVSSPTEISNSSTFAGDSFFDTSSAVPVAAAHAAVLPPLQSAASLLFESYEDEETLVPDTPLYSAPMTPITPGYPAPPAPLVAPVAQFDPWSNSDSVLSAAPAVPSAPVRPTAPPKPQKTIDIFGDDLLHPAPVQASAPPKPAPSSKPRNPLDLLSLYDQPLTPSQPKMASGPNTGMGSMGNGNGLTRGMSPMGAPSPMGFRPAGTPMQPIQPMQMPLQGGMQGGMQGGFSPQQPGRGGPMMMSPQGGSSSMYGGAPVPTMGSKPVYSSTSSGRMTGGPASNDPFDSINMLKR